MVGSLVLVDLYQLLTRVRTLQVAAIGRPVVASRQSAVKAQALFGLGGSKKAAASGTAPQYHICVGKRC